MLGIGMDRSLYYVLLQLDWPVLSIRKWFRWLETVAGTIARFNSLFRLVGLVSRTDLLRQDYYVTFY
jgi:hypothetical protein